MRNTKLIGFLLVALANPVIVKASKSVGWAGSLPMRFGDR